MRLASGRPPGTPARRGALAYMLTTAALITAVVTGPASPFAGTVAQTRIARAHAVPSATCWPKIKCGDDCCVLA